MSNLQRGTPTKKTLRSSNPSGHPSSFAKPRNKPEASFRCPFPPSFPPNTSRNNNWPPAPRNNYWPPDPRNNNWSPAPRNNNWSPAPQPENQVIHQARQPMEESRGFQTSELLKVIEAIRQELLCCGCRKPLSAARLCRNGHGVCPDCLNWRKGLCPRCRTATKDKAPVLLNNIIKLLPRRCEFHEQGCEAEVLAKDKEHEKFCRFRQTQCEMRDCGWAGPAMELMSHLAGRHGAELVRCAKRTQILVDFDSTVDKKSVVPILAFNTLFWQHTVIKDRQLVQFYRYVPMSRPTREFSAFVSFHTPERVAHAWVAVHLDSTQRAALEGKTSGEVFKLEKGVMAAFHRYYSGVQYTFEVTESQA